MALGLGQKGKQAGKPQPHPKLHDAENVHIAEGLAAYFKREVLPHASDAWSGHDKSRVGYEIPFNRHFNCLVKVQKQRAQRVLRYPNACAETGPWGVHVVFEPILRATA